MLYTVGYTFPGRLSTMAHPPGGDQLSAAMAALREQGVDVLVSALPVGQQDQADLLGEAVAAEAAGIEFCSLPIEDFGIPDRVEVTSTLMLLSDQLRHGRHVVTHCWAGIGRSSLIAASLLVLNGIEPDEAWSLISEARGIPVPETDQQRDWVAGFPRST